MKNAAFFLTMLGLVFLPASAVKFDDGQIDSPLMLAEQQIIKPGPCNRIIKKLAESDLEIEQPSSCVSPQYVWNEFTCRCECVVNWTLCITPFYFDIGICNCKCQATPP